MIDYLSVQVDCICYEIRKVSFSERKSRLVMRGGKTTLWRGGFFFCRFIGLERRVHHDNVLCGLARCFSSGYGKRTEQSAIRLLRMAVRWQWRKRAESSADKGLSFQSWQSLKKKIMTGKYGKQCQPMICDTDILWAFP